MSKIFVQENARSIKAYATTTLYCLEDGDIAGAKYYAQQIEIVADTIFKEPPRNQTCKLIAVVEETK